MITLVLIIAMKFYLKAEESICLVMNPAIGKCLVFGTEIRSKGFIIVNLHIREAVIKIEE